MTSGLKPRESTKKLIRGAEGHVPKASGSAVTKTRKTLAKPGTPQEV